MVTGALADLAVAEKQRNALAKQVRTLPTSVVFVQLRLVLLIIKYWVHAQTVFYTGKQTYLYNLIYGKRALLTRNGSCCQTVLEEIRQMHGIPEGLSEAEVASCQWDTSFCHALAPMLPGT